MKQRKLKYIFLFLMILFSKIGFSQIENLIIETYYVADANDATDTTGGGVEVGTKTYRIFVDLKPNCKLKKVFGNEFHPLVFKSTENFFNNKVDGQTLAKNFNRLLLKENTVALDTWITIGQITTRDTLFGVQKIYDTNGSFIGGNNNDGGSSQIVAGLLINNTEQIGVPLTTSDGIDYKVSDSTSWFVYGKINEVTALDSTIFGYALPPAKEFISTNSGWISSRGSSGVDAQKNEVLIAQLSTKGELTLKLNVEVEIPDGDNFRTVTYVAKGDTLLEGEEISPFLSYPFVCGCRDADYLEYKNIYACDNLDSCKTKIVLGCMDTSACNYNSKANYNLSSLCCYPGYCNDRNLSVVCPQFEDDANKFYLFPNPSSQNINFNMWLTRQEELKYSILNLYGVEVQAETSMGVAFGDIYKEIDLLNLQSGVYLFRLNRNGNYYKKVFIKR
jgi:hypothetical protein